MHIILSRAVKRKMLLSRDVKYPPRLPGYNYFMPASGIVYLHQPCIYGIRNLKLSKSQINTMMKREKHSEIQKNYIKISDAVSKKSKSIFSPPY